MGSAAEPTTQRPWIDTPLIQSFALSQATGCSVFLKLENLQPAGSFKSRGIGNLILHNIKSARHPECLHFYSSSGGNAGLACVTAARSLGYPATVVVPVSTKPFMIAKIRAAGATRVMQHGASWTFADQYLRDVVMPDGKQRGEEVVYVPPFDHPVVWQGNSTIVPDIRKQMPRGEKPDAIICSVGGGGLFCGVMQGLDQEGWGDVLVLAMETIGCDSLWQSLKAGEVITLPGITSIATSLGAVRVAKQAFEYAKRENVRNAVLDDAEACMGVWRLADDERLLVEPACGVNIAPCYNGMLRKIIPGFGPQSKIVVVVCGGQGVSIDMVADWKSKYGAMLNKEGWQTKNGVVPSSHTTPVD